MDTNADILHRLKLLEQGHQLLQKSIEENTRVTRRIEESTADIVSLFSNAKNGASLILKLLSFAKWLGGIIVTLGAVYTVYQALSHGTLPVIKMPGD